MSSGRPLLQRRRIVIATALTVALAGCGGSTGSTSSPGAEASKAAAATTPTPAATATPTASPEPTPTAPATPGPPLVQTTGKGDKVVKFDAHDSPSVATFTHKGKANFAVLSYIGTERDDLLVNTIGAYTGSVYVSAAVDKFQITADGAWTVDAKPVTEAQTWDGSAALKGRGDAVLILPGAANKSMQIDATGDSNFAIIAYDVTGERLDLLVNEISAYSGEVLLPDADPLVLAITGEGESWTLAPPQG
jgi:hypothetical protein